MNRLTIPVVLLMVALSVRFAAADWATYRSNAARTGYTAEALPAELALRWVYRSAHKPQPAWPRSDRMPFDRAFHVVSDGESLYFGSSVDGAIYSLDANTGRQRWRFFTDAPIRFAPALWKDTVFAVSDDGVLYALSTKDGSLLWHKRGGADEKMVLGNERLVSKWPARGGPAVVDDTVYFAAGIWPSDGILLYALDAATGQEKWVNRDSGSIYMPQPHGGANAKSGVSAQGYLVVSGDHLLVPTGRAVPASFNRHTGKFEYFHLQQYGHNGGEPTMAIGDMFFNSGLGFSATSGQRVSNLGGGQLAATADGLVRAAGNTLSAYRWVETVKPDRKGEPVKTTALEALWTMKEVHGGASLMVAKDTIVSSGEGRVTVVDATNQQVAWTAEVEGVAYGLAVSDGRLLVSTDQGLIYCFDGSGQRIDDSPRSADSESPYGENQIYADAAEEIIRKAKITEGYCVDLGCGDGALAYELARRTSLYVYAVDDDPAKVQTAREKLSAAGVYGSRVTVHLRKLTATSYPGYIANLIVSRRSIDNGVDAVPRAEAKRLQRPYGGAVCIGKPAEMEVEFRGELSGAGSWTHQYADAANTLNSGDSLIGGNLGMFWFRDFDFDVPQRHGRAPAPLFANGRLFHEGINGILAVDAYNGRELWRYEIEGLLRAYDGDELMGVAGTGSNFCLAGDSVYIRDGGRCLRLDAANGTLLGEFKPPPLANGKPSTWGYIASVDGILYGTTANEDHVVTYRYRATTGDMKRLLTESHTLFALDAVTGEMRWRYDAKDSIRHNAIAIGDGKVCLIDRPLAMFDREKRSTTKEHPTGRLLALDAKSGKLTWQNDEDIYGTMLALSAEHNALLMSYQPTRFRLDSEVGGRMSVFNLKDGKRRWEANAKYESRPTINDRTIYAQGGAWDLLTGEPRPFNFGRSYGCGILAGSRDLMFFRSATLGFFDLTENKQTENFGGMRPGCWVNAIPAGGVVLVPDASAGCQCSYLNKAWIALQVEE